MSIIGSGFAYADIDSIPEELIKVEYEIDKKTGETIGFKKPKKKKWVVESEGKTFEVVSKVQKALNEIWSVRYEQLDDEDDEDFAGEDFALKLYDPSTLFDMCKDYNIPTEGYIHDGTGMRITNPTAALFMTSAGFIGKEKIDIESLDDATVDKRINVFVHILMRCCDEDVANELVARAAKKKNGTLHKGRLLRIAHMDLTDEDGNVYVVVAKNDSDTKMSIEFRVVDLNSEWYYESDLFTSTDLLLKSKPEGSEEKLTVDKGTKTSEKKPSKKSATVKAGPGSSKYFDIEDGVLKKYKGADEIVTIPEGVKTIDKNAFDGNKTIKKVIMPDSVTSIKEAAFRYCSNLEEVVFSKKLTSVAPLAFAADISLRSIDLSNTKIKIIRKKCFVQCESLETVKLPNGLKTIEEYAFTQTAMKECHLPDSVEKYPLTAFNRNITFI